MTSPRSSPAAAAGEPRSTVSMRTPESLGNQSARSPRQRQAAADPSGRPPGLPNPTPRARRSQAIEEKPSPGSLTPPMTPRGSKRQNAGDASSQDRPCPRIGPVSDDVGTLTLTRRKSTTHCPVHSSPSSSRHSHPSRRRSRRHPARGGGRARMVGRPRRRRASHRRPRSFGLGRSAAAPHSRAGGVRCAGHRNDRRHRVGRRVRGRVRLRSHHCRAGDDVCGDAGQARGSLQRGRDGHLRERRQPAHREGDGVHGGAALGPRRGAARHDQLRRRPRSFSSSRETWRAGSPPTRRCPSP